MSEQSTFPTPSYELSNEGRKELTYLMMEADIHQFTLKEEFRGDVKTAIVQLHGYIWAVTPSGQRAATDNAQFKRHIENTNNLSIDNRILLDQIIGPENADKLRQFDIQTMAGQQKSDKQYLVITVKKLCKKYKIKYQSGDNIPARLMTLIAEAANMPLKKNTINNLIKNSC